MSRIIAGSRRGQRLATPDHLRTRPTSDRVRESAFNLVAGWAGTAGEAADVMLHGFSFLDLYGGSGGVALEAASRGADPVVCVERDRATAALARRNAVELGLPVEVVAASVETFLAGASQPFDLVWLDPPYDTPGRQVEDDVAAVVSRGWLAPDGLVVVERSSRDAPLTWPDVLVGRRSRRYGETTLHLASREDL